ncbi:hypothetical protein F5Y09DRAFT_329042 [Xylaria sp. FL1042]|nr:hypothetical protein F5Y09DRAFT_329042 [Xylaria sp. FL1042]
MAVYRKSCSESKRDIARYHLDEKEEEAENIISTVAYRWGKLLDAGISMEPGDFAKHYWAVAASFPHTSKTENGSLEKLPLELWHDLFLHLDMYSLIKFRQTCLQSRELVESLPEYQRVASMANHTGGLDLFWALFRTGLAADVTLFEFHSALCTKDCAFCGNFAPFICLLPWKRCCLKCINSAPQAELQELEEVQKLFKLTKTESKQLRSIKTIPGSYGLDGAVYESSLTVVSTEQVRSILRRRKDFDIRKKLDFGWPRIRLNFVGVCKLPYYDNHTGRFEQGLTCHGCHKETLFTRDGFLEHFQSCDGALSIWKCKALKIKAQKHLNSKG